jgi:nucleoid DNA-binding protein
MKKYELIAAVAKKTGITQVDVNKVIDAMGEVIVETCVENGDDVNLPNLGKFKQKVNKARKGINPLNKQPLDIKESHTLKFTPTSTIKKVVESKPSNKSVKK